MEDFVTKWERAQELYRETKETLFRTSFVIPTPLDFLMNFIEYSEQWAITQPSHQTSTALTRYFEFMLANFPRHIAKHLRARINGDLPLLYEAFQRAS